MSTFAAEQTFYDAVAAAESVRQVAQAKAFATYGYVQANYAAYLTALVLANTNYITSINSAASAGGIDPAMGVSGPLAAGRWSKVGGY